MLSTLPIANYVRWLERQDSLPRRERALQLGETLGNYQLDQINDEDRRAIASAALCHGGELSCFEEWGCSTSEFLSWIQGSPCDLGTQLHMLEAVVASMTCVNKMEPIHLKWTYEPARSYDDAIAEQQRIKTAKDQRQQPIRPSEKVIFLRVAKSGEPD